MTNTYFSPVPRGLETLLGEELQRLGATQVNVVPGGAEWQGDWTACWRVNLESRLATRVLWRLGSGTYRAEADIYKFAYGLTWAKWFSASDTIRVYVTAQKVSLKSLSFITLRIKDAVCDHFRAVRGARPNVDTHHPAVRIHAFLTENTVTLYLDTSGEPLYKRGFKPGSVQAPLKENLAAGLIQMTDWQTDEPLIDPMCGSGTFLIEAAQMALDIAPGLGRSFAFERLTSFDRAAWKALRDVAEARRKPLRELAISGSDIEGGQVRRAWDNLASAGLKECVRLDRADILLREAPAASGVMIANPPYGVRLGELEELAEFYPLLGDALKQRWSGWRCHFLTADMNFAKLIRLKASRRTPIFNGDLDCRLFRYEIASGSFRKPAAVPED